MEYRLATSDELAELAKLRWELWLEDGEHPAQVDEPSFAEAFANWLRPQLGVDWFVWCAIQNGLIISQIYVQRIAKLPKPSSAIDAFGYITSVYTKPEFRNQGIGTVLLAKAKEWALASDLEFLVLWPSANSIPFWNRADFSENDSLIYQVRPYIN